MARYYWDVQTLRRELEKFRKRIDKETDPTKKAELNYYYDTCNEMIFSFFLAPDPRRSRAVKMVSNYSSFLRDQRYFFLTEPFTCAFEQNLRLYNETMTNLESLDDEVQKITKVHVGREQAVSLCNDFYRDLDSELYECFLPFYNERFNHLRFLKKAKENGTTVTHGQQYFFSGINTSFVEVHALDNPYMPFTLIHESGHVIDDKYNPEARLNMTYFYEVFTLFVELVAAELRVGNFDNLFYSNYLARKISSVYTFASEAIDYDHLMPIYKKNKYKIDDTFYEMAKDEEGYTKKEVNRILFKEDMNNIVYPISYSLALYYFNAYKADKKEGLMELKKFLSIVDRDELIPLYSSDSFNKLVESELRTILTSSNEAFKKELVKKV